jgi:sulfur-oxidizing protein SoxA
MTRAGILAGTAAITLLAGAVVLAGGPIASAQSKKQAPLELKGDASERPWKRYAGWPTRDESKYNTLGNLASPPAPKSRARSPVRLPAMRKKAPSLRQTVTAAAHA